MEPGASSRFQNPYQQILIVPLQSWSYQSSVSFSILGSYEEDPWTVEMR